MAALKKIHRPRKPFTPARIAVFLAIGFLLGLGLGYVFMGTTHSILQTKDAKHYGHGEAESAGQEQADAGGSGGSGSSGAGSDTIHTLCTGNGSPYQNYQLRIAYATYKLVQAMPGGERHVGFTRVLHRTKPDPLMGEIKTFRADPLQPKCDDWCEYPVSDRGNAVQQFFTAAAKDPGMIKGRWIYMIESDYVFMKPLPIPSEESQSKFKAWGYPFDYIHPAAHPEEMRKLFPEASGPVSDIPGTGPAPILMRAADWAKVVPDWEKYTAVIEADEGMKSKLGWVHEMYAFSVALAANKMTTELKPPGLTDLIAQLPIDSSLDNAHAFHYTQCTIYKTMDNQDVWAYDKRFHTALEESLTVPAIEAPPAFQEGKWKFIEGKPVTAGVHKAIEQMIGQMNAGIKTLQPIAATGG